MPRLNLGRVVGTPGQNASITLTQAQLGMFAYSAEDALVRAQGNVDVAAGGVLSVDGVQLAEGDIVLLADQADRTENGLYMVQTGSWTRAPGYAAGAAFDFRYIAVASGETGAGKIYTVGTEQYTIGQTEIEFAETAFSTTNLPGKVVIRDRNGNFEGGMDEAALAEIRDDISAIEDSIGEIESDVGGVQNDIGAIQSDVAKLKDFRQWSALRLYAPFDPAFFEGKPYYANPDNPPEVGQSPGLFPEKWKLAGMDEALIGAIRSEISRIKARNDALWAEIFGEGGLLDGSAITFDTLEGVVLERGVWNRPMARLEC